MSRADPWTRACEKFKEDLSEEEKRVFSAASPDNLLAGTLISYQRHEANSKSHRVIKALEPFVSTIRDYGAALDVLANTYSLVLSPLWGCIRIILRIAEEAGKFFDKVVEMFGRIADVLPRLHVYERLFANHDRLLDMISTAYFDILNFCIDAKNTFRKRGPVFKHLYWRPFQLRFENSLVNMRNHLKSVEKEAMLSHMIETSEERSLAKQDDGLRKAMIKAEQKTQFLKSLSTVAYEKIHRRASKLRHAGSCGWLLATDQYREWINSTSSVTLSVMGIPGCGKTILASSLVDAFANHGTLGRPVLYHYCDCSDPPSLTLQSIVGTLLKQLLLYMDNLPQVILSQIERSTSFLVQCPSDDDLLSLLNAAMERFDEVVVILDAIDECDKETQKDVIDLVKHLHFTKDALVRCIVFSREEAKLTSGFKAYPSLKISSTATSSDISAFVHGSIAERIEMGDLVLRAPELKDLITSTLVDGAHGMFLWVRLQLDELCEASSDKEIRSILRDLPIGLTEIYTKILRKIHANSLRCAMAKKIFRWLACAKRTLELSELAEAVAFSAADSTWNAESIPNGLRALQACKNLVTLDGETQQVRFVHHTVRQLLLSQYLLDDSKLKEFRFIAVEESNAIAEILCAYLCFSDFETQLARVNHEARSQLPDPARTQESLMKMPHEMPLGTLMLTVWKVLRGTHSIREAPSLKFPQPIVEQDIVPKALEKYRLLDYAVQHWLSHAKDVSGMLNCFLLTNELSRRRFESLVFDKKLPFSFRPWDNLHRSAEYPHMPMFRWAVRNGHVQLLGLLDGPLLHTFWGRDIIKYTGSAYNTSLRRYCTEEIENDRSPLLWVVENGLFDILNALNNTRIRSFRPHTAQQLLCAAACQPSSEVLLWVMKKTEGQVDANDLLKALIAAIESERDSIVKLIADETNTFIATTRPFEATARPRLSLNLSTVDFCKMLDGLHNFSSRDVVQTMVTHVLVPSMSLSESSINYEYLFTWAIENDEALLMQVLMNSLKRETVTSSSFQEAVESVVSNYDQEKEVLKPLRFYMQLIDASRRFNKLSPPSIPKAMAKVPVSAPYLS